MEGTPLGEGRGGGTRRIAGKRWSGDGTAAPGSWRRRRGGQDCRQTVSRPPNALGARTHAGPCNGARQQRSSTRHPPQAPTARPHCRGTAPTPLAPVSRVGGGRHAAAPMSGIRSGGYGRRVSVWRSGATAKLGDPGGAGWRWRNAATRAVGGGVWPIPRPSAGSSRGRRCWGGGGGAATPEGVGWSADGPVGRGASPGGCGVCARRGARVPDRGGPFAEPPTEFIRPTAATGICQRCCSSISAPLRVAR